MSETFTICGQRFSSRIDPRTGTPYIESIHPYDETEYHWARQGVVGTCWFVFRDGKRVGTLGRMTRDEVAQALLNLDAQAHLERRGGIW